MDDSGHYTKPSGGIPASDLADGVVPVEDVQVNGTSVVTDGVANVPFATSSRLGVIYAAGGGLALESEGRLVVQRSTNDEVKLGVNGQKPVVPVSQHLSTFYGLAKAAGDATQSASSNAVGAYTEDAKVAIQKMLGIYEPPWELLNDITLSEIGGIDLTADDDGVPYDLLSVYMYLFYPANSESINSGYSRFRFYDDANVGENYYKAYAETGKYTTSTNIKFKHILLERKKNMTLVMYTQQTAIGSNAAWVSKMFAGIDHSNGGIIFDAGTIKRIKQAPDDTEPAGTRILIYGQRAY